jgi:hypothetical protein
MVDHFERVLAHFDDDRLLQTTCDYMWRAHIGRQEIRAQYADRAERCRAGRERRGIPVPGFSLVEQ